MPIYEKYHNGANVFERSRNGYGHLKTSNNTVLLVMSYQNYGNRKIQLHQIP